MYARLARFEGSDPKALERELEQMRAQIEGGSTSGGPDQAQMEEMRKLIKRVLVLADLEKGSSAMVVFCDTEDEIRRIDEMFNQMSPGDDGGRRLSADIYEVAIDNSSSS
jgi:hypothetical protein